MNKFPRMKNALILLLAAAATLTIAGCSGGDSSSSSASTASESSVVSVSESSAESSEAASGTSSEASSESSSETSAEPESSVSAEATDIGEGETAFTFIVTLDDGSSTYYNVHTDETTVGAALLGVGLIEGDESEYGLYVKTVDGVTKDYDADGQYWSFYIDGEYAMSGVDSTDIVAGSSYEFRVENA